LLQNFQTWKNGTNGNTINAGLKFLAGHDHIPDEFLGNLFHIDRAVLCNFSAMILFPFSASSTMEPIGDPPPFKKAFKTIDLKSSQLSE
jgi:hypothetical protein